MTVTPLQKKSIFSNPLKVPVGPHVTSQAKFILASTAAYVTSKVIVFFVDIAPVNSHTDSQNCWGPSCFVKIKIKRVTRRLLRKDLNKLSLRLLTGL